jgi:hypothetical protein
MMKNLLIITAASLLIIGCAEKTPDTTNAADSIAADKMKIVEVLKLADAKGTAGEAFMEAAKDSSLAAKMRIAINDVTPVSAAQTQTPRYNQPAAPKKDDLEKAAETLEKTGKVVDQAGELKRKTEDAMKK